MRVMIWFAALLFVTGAVSATAARDLGHGHAGGTMHSRTQVDGSATREFKAVQARMMQKMAMPFTGDPDVDFQMHMIPHHQAAMDMARVALRHARDPWTRRQAQAILIAQQQEIAQFQKELARRGAVVPPGGHPRYIINANTLPDPENERDETGTRDELVGKTWAPGSGIPRAQRGGRVDMSATRAFKAANMQMMHNSMAAPFTGDPDVDFRTHMIPHHRGAIDMSRVALRHAKNPWVRQAANAIITAQQGEIYAFQGWLARRGQIVPPGR